MLLLSAIPQEWDHIASMYCKDMTRQRATFEGVCSAIMAEYERIACPSQLAHTANRLSAVKRKGKSPQFKEQRCNSAPKPSADDAPSRSSNKKQKWRGGQKEKAQRANSIVSSAFIPTSVLNRMQESHHHASTSRIEEVPVKPTLAPGYTMVGGPSHAPVRSVAPVQVATFKPTGISYAKVTLLPMQSTSGSSSKPAPFRMDKEHELLKKAGIQPTAEPLKTAYKALEVDNKLEQMKEVLRKHKNFCKFAAATPIVQNTVAAKKAKKESAHLPASQLPHGRTLGNIQVFPEVSTNPIAENGEPLFYPGNQVVFPNSPSIINPKHPHAKYFKALIELLNMDDDEEHLNDKSLDVDYSPILQVEHDEPLNWGTPSDIEQELEAQDEQSSSNLDDNIASATGMSRLSITPAPSNRSSKSKGKQRKRTPHGGGDQDNFPDSHAYNDYGYHRSVSTNLPTCMLSDDGKTQLLNSLSSLESRVELVCNNISSHTTNCVKCKIWKTQDAIEIMADSGASSSFMHTKSDLSEYEVLIVSLSKLQVRLTPLKLKGEVHWL